MDEKAMREAFEAKYGCDMGGELFAAFMGGYRAALSQKAEAPGWRPIESAPKDGTAVLVYGQGHLDHSAMHWREKEGRAITIAAWTPGDIGVSAHWSALETTMESSYGGEENSFDYSEAVEIAPTHWMPLPAAPKVSGYANGQAFWNTSQNSPKATP